MSNEKKWTPGPWEGNRFGDLKGSDGTRVSLYGPVALEMSPTPKSRANYCLAVASPLLYDALERCEALVVAWATHHAMTGRYPDTSIVGMEDWHPVHREIYENLKAALAAARGER